MEQFGNDVQKVNNGKLSVKKFKKNLGKSNYDIFSNEAYTSINNSEANPSASYIRSKKYSSLVAESALMNMIEYSNIAQEKAAIAQEKAAIAQANSEKRAAILEKLLRGIKNLNLPDKMKEMGEYLEKETKNQRVSSQNIHYPETR